MSSGEVGETMSKRFPEHNKTVAEHGMFGDGKRYINVWRQLTGDKKTFYEGIAPGFPDGFLIEGVTAEGDDGVLQAFDMFDAQMEKAMEALTPRILRASSLPRGNGRGKREVS